jgi:membrane protein DedA with SNARE-associated domain
MQSTVVHWGYVALFLITALSAFGIPVGSELAMAFGGALASGQVLTNPPAHFALGLVILVAVLGELVGGLLGYSFGRTGGRPLVNRLGRYVLLTKRDLDGAERFLARRGEPFVLVGRVIPLLRSFVSIVAGFAEMTLWRFLLFSFIGDLIFTALLSSLGYELGGRWHTVVKDFSYAAGVIHRLRVLRRERLPPEEPDSRHESFIEK